MSIVTNEHPSKDLLAEFAFGDDNSNITEHVSGCVDCQKYVEEVKSISSRIQTLPDETVPPNLENKILKSIDKKSFSWFDFNSTRKILNPLIISLGLIGMILFVYIYMVFVLN